MEGEMFVVAVGLMARVPRFFTQPGSVRLLIVSTGVRSSSIRWR